MDSYKATMIVECVESAESYMEYMEAIACLIKTGLAWSLQGFFGHTCRQFIDDGMVTPEGELLVDQDYFDNLEDDLIGDTYEEIDDDGWEIDNDDPINEELAKVVDEFEEESK